jgi:uncharacterized protein (TIGR02001 family)
MLKELAELASDSLSCGWHTSCLDAVSIHASREAGVFDIHHQKGNPMKKIILASAITAAFAGSFAHAEEAAPEQTVAFNVGVASEYRYRAISQTAKNPALSGGVDYTHNPTGLYAGAWASTISWVKDDGGGNVPVEIDLYAGKRGEIGGGLTYDVGGFYYYYPNNSYASISASTANANTFEVYGQVGFGPAYLKYSHALTNTFGSADSKNSYYIDAGVNQEITDGYVANLHVGYQHLKNVTDGSYTDWKIGVTKDFGVVVASLAYIDTNASENFYFKKGKGTAVLSLVKNF